MSLAAQAASATAEAAALVASVVLMMAWAVVLVAAQPLCSSAVARSVSALVRCLARHGCCRWQSSQQRRGHMQAPRPRAADGMALLLLALLLLVLLLMVLALDVLLLAALLLLGLLLMVLALDVLLLAALLLVEVAILASCKDHPPSCGDRPPSCKDRPPRAQGTLPLLVRNHAAAWSQAAAAARTVGGCLRCRRVWPRRPRTLPRRTAGSTSVGRSRTGVGCRGRSWRCRSRRKGRT